MNAKPALVAIGIAIAMVAFNFAYANGVPQVLEKRGIPAVPFGYRESGSPTADAGAIFRDVTARAGISFAHVSWGDQPPPYPAIVAGGVAVGDVNEDGFDDIFLSPAGPGLPGKLYLNDGHGGFRDATNGSGLDHLTGWGTAVAFADYDNDGHLDLYVGMEGASHLLKGDGAGHFVDVTEIAKVSNVGMCNGDCMTSGVTWFDYNRDGLLDLLVINNVHWDEPGLHTSGASMESQVYFAAAQPALLYRNNGDGTFTEVSSDVGLENTGKGLDAVAADFDGDGWPDVFIANDLSANTLLHNDHGHFVDVSHDAGVDERKTGMGVAVGDVTGNGRLDILVSEFRGYEASLFMNDGAMKFHYGTDAAKLAGSVKGTGWGASLVDYDNDGKLDVAIAVGRSVPLGPHLDDVNNLVFKDKIEDSQDELFRNVGNGTFADVAATAGDWVDRWTTRGLAVLDYNHDGYPDFARVNIQGEPTQLLENQPAKRNHFVEARLVGSCTGMVELPKNADGTAACSPRDAFGANITATRSDGVKLFREIVSGTSYESGDSHALFLGLGDATSVSLHIVWPSGIVQDVPNIPADSFPTIKEPSG
ncbi:MAG: CRTAC1 family protein [Thermoplasmatota archaeon]